MLRILATLVLVMTVMISNLRADDHTSRYAAELNGLFGNLAVSETLDDSNDIITRIWQLWTTDTKDSVNIQMMRRGIGFMETGDLPNAEAMFTLIINRDPNFMEAWNKRATIRYLLGNLKGSEDDIAEVLKREPRHFGAWAGLGMINIQRDDLPAALSIYNNILTIHPLNPDANRLIPEIELKLRGDPA